MKESEILKKINESDSFVELCIKKIYELQTLDEQAIDQTRHNNKVGLTSGDASKAGAYSRILESGHLTSMSMKYARSMIRKYAGQLVQLFPED